MCHPLLDASLSKRDLPSVQESSPQLPEYSGAAVPTQTPLCFWGFSQTVKIVTTSGEPSFPEVLSVNAGDDYHLLHSILV